VLRSLPAPFVVAGLLGAVLFGYALGSAGRKQARRPETVAAALARLEEKGLKFHIVTASTEGAPTAGAYLCDRPRRRSEMHVLPRLPAQGERWQGVLLLEPLREGAPLSESDILAWGAHGARVGRLLLFGDPALVRLVADALEGG
jgi:hypothetical protein